MTQRPHVLLISADHWPAELLGEAGHPDILTPTLDDLARSGVRFRNAYSECPVCIPARRTLMTGVSPRTHGDRDFGETKPMPSLPTMAQTFRDAGYQAYAVGKLHVYPQRNRIGFDDVILDEEGRTQYGVIDDYELFLADRGYPGRQFDHGMSNNDYVVRPWHLTEELHATNWATHQIVRTIKRRDPDRPAFWFLSYRHPHPPIVPLEMYLQMYRDLVLRWPVEGSWCRNELPYLLQAVRRRSSHMGPRHVRDALRAFYALCTHIDHQLRVVIGTLREEALLDDTVICFTSDHGDMLGRHGMWAKRLFYEPSAKIPMILVGAERDGRIGHRQVDDRLVGWQDVMPTLLDLAGIKVPGSVEGRSMLGDWKREWLYGEVGEGDHATRMIRKGQFKLIYYPAGNVRQLFDVEADPLELKDLSGHEHYEGVLAEVSVRAGRELRKVKAGGEGGEKNLDKTLDTRNVFMASADVEAERQRQAQPAWMPVQCQLERERRLSWQLVEAKRQWHYWRSLHQRAKGRIEQWQLRCGEAQQKLAEAQQRSEQQHARIQELEQENAGLKQRNQDLLRSPFGKRSEKRQSGSEAVLFFRLFRKVNPTLFLRLKRRFFK